MAGRAAGGGRGAAGSVDVEQRLTSRLSAGGPSCL
jgi:hypothetical protein